MRRPRVRPLLKVARLIIVRQIRRERLAVPDDRGLVGAAQGEWRRVFQQSGYPVHQGGLFVHRGRRVRRPASVRARMRWGEWLQAAVARRLSLRLALCSSRSRRLAAHRRQRHVPPRFGSAAVRPVVRRGVVRVIVRRLVDAGEGEHGAAALVVVGGDVRCAVRVDAPVLLAAAGESGLFPRGILRRRRGGVPLLPFAEGAAEAREEAAAAGVAAEQESEEDDQAEDGGKGAAEARGMEAEAREAWAAAAAAAAAAATARAAEVARGAAAA
ncbi:hypothetical protein AB1Y20_010699 [Prymnesium parvum]|uniref:Uncharacterized protein n=1 Tax=Prymnesium parvum TaxID=97485 RepID=A0AB34IPH0_PRYPA